MKTCDNCGFINLIDNKAKLCDVRCENCKKQVFKPYNKHLPITDGNIETKRKLMHDEMPWEFNN